VAEQEPPNHPEQEDRRQGQTERKSTIEEQIGAPLRELSGQIASLRAPFRDFSDHVTSFRDELKNSSEEEQRERRRYEAEQLRWLRAGTKWSIGCPVWD
jgi:hypothetical protein